MSLEEILKSNIGDINQLSGMKKYFLRVTRESLQPKANGSKTGAKKRQRSKVCT